jgi:hypothetical protein
VIDRTSYAGQLVDDRADIVDDDVTQHPRGAGLGIDLDLAE